MHACPFCGWSRIAASAVVLPAGCPRCGCAVDSGEGPLSPPDGEPTPIALPSSRMARVVLGAIVIAFFYAAAYTGNELLGAPGAAVALGLAGFLLLPLVPERLPAKR